MPIRTASIAPQLKKNGAGLHLAMASRIRSNGANAAPSEHEQALLEERKALKAEQAARAEKAAAPVRKAVVVTAPKPVKVAKVKAPKAEKEPKAGKDAKGAKAKPSRAEKLVKKAGALEAAKKAERKSAKP